MRLIFPILVVVLVLGCSKDKFTTKPQLNYKSVNSTNISGDQLLELRFELTDKEGDFSSFLGYRKTVKGCSASDKFDTAFFSIPDEFIQSKQTKGDLVITLNKNQRGSNACNLPGGGTRPDTTVFSFWTRDKAGNLSDTAFSEEIIILP